MAVRYDSNERAPFEFTKPSSRQKVVGCPNCKVARNVSVNCVGFHCRQCNNWINDRIWIKEDECTSYLNTSQPINTEFTKMKAKMEKEAYEWRDAQEAKGTLGKKSHEPGYEKRNW